MVIFDTIEQSKEQNGVMVFLRNQVQGNGGAGQTFLVGQ